ncbi:hypothetical protein HMPREF0388_0536 [Mobiluncus curtisii ATCC 51333]|uniref:Uncharacterized protein n=1 Tax=Mobiluncus curtisii ATCC 51333 TaxID=887326 RepID=E6LWY9_9ACTO|nr:hypothetical protein HMPREF0388_0536 [Mobiluncus curtisii ATCC 51333]
MNIPSGTAFDGIARHSGLFPTVYRHNSPRPPRPALVQKP